MKKDGYEDIEIELDDEELETLRSLAESGEVLNLGLPESPMLVQIILLEDGTFQFEMVKEEEKPDGEATEA